MSATAENFSTLFQASRDQLPGADDATVAALRDKAMDSFSGSGLPSKRQEAWRYTDVSALAGVAFATRRELPALDQALSDLRSRYTLNGALVLAFVDGVFDAGASNVSTLPEGLELATLDSDGAALKRLGEQDAATASEPFTALNTAFTTTGAVISVARGAAISTPLQIIHVATRADSGAGDSAVMANPRLEISMAPGSSLELVEVFLGAGDTANFNNCVTEISLADSARLAHLKVQQEADAAWHIAATRVRQEAGSHYAVQSIAIGGGTARQDIAIALNGRGAEAELSGLYLADGRRHTDHRLLIDHDAVETISDQNFKGILGDRARGVFNGKVVVQQDAQRIRADQSNRNLLLSELAEANTKPELEIYADDVKCSHGATVGQLDETALFYLRSRGIPLDVARALLTYAFARDIIDGIRYPSLKQCLMDDVLGHLPQTEEVKELL